MNKIKLFVALVLIAFIGIVGLGLTINAGDALSTNQGDTLFYNRYFTTSKTPISDLNELIGSGTSGTTGQVKVHDGTDYEPKTITTTGDITGTLVAAGTMATTLAVNTVESANIAIANVATSDLADSAVTSAKIAIANVQASDIFTNTVSLIIAAGTISNTATVESGSILLSVFPRVGFSNDYTIINTVFSGTSWIVNTDAHPADMIADGLFMRP